jgi:hypothetical protein
MVIVLDDENPDNYWALFIEHVTDEDLERIRSRRDVRLKVKEILGDFMANVEAPQSPPDRRHYEGPTIRMGFESQEWGLYPWLP